jgi:YfiH family protein
MQKHHFETLVNWQFETFNDIKSIKHLVTGKNVHRKVGHIPGLNFSYSVDDEKAIVAANRKLISEILHAPSAEVIIPEQTHSDNIGVVTINTLDKSWFDTDALITQMPGVIIGVLSADCVPVLLVDPVKGVVAAIHAGWKGTAKSIVPKTIHQMCAQFGCNTNDIIAGIGPSISCDQYEVGEEVANHFRAESQVKKENGKSCLNLWIENEIQLLESGIKKENISIAGMCTFSNSELFYSARREGFKTGRMASFISLTQ